MGLGRRGKLVFMNTSPRRTRTLAVFALLAFACGMFGQTTTSHLKPAGGGGGSGTITGNYTGDLSTIITGIPLTAAANSILMADGSTLSWAVGGQGWQSGTAETRKDDGHGPTLIQVRDSARRLNRNELAPAQYIVLAKSVGVEPEEAELLQAIHDADLTIYDFSKVDNYLYRQALKQKADMHWVWKPVRDADLARIVENGTVNWQSIANMGVVFAKLYSQQVPMHVLAEMKVILETVPDAMFMISDYEVVKPDPFLAVTTKKLLGADKIWIIDQWDEPGFGSDAEPERVLARR
jgi:hypothetical protein